MFDKRNNVFERFIKPLRVKLNLENIIGGIYPISRETELHGLSYSYHVDSALQIETPQASITPVELASAQIFQFKQESHTTISFSILKSLAYRINGVSELLDSIEW